MSVLSSQRAIRLSSCVGAAASLAVSLLSLSADATPSRVDASAASASNNAQIVALSTSTGTTDMRYDFGAVGMASGNTLQRAYTLRNSGTSPLTIQEVTTSCGCTHAVLDSQDHGLSGCGPTITEEPIVLAPGQAARLRLTVNISQPHPDPIRKTVTVSGASDAAPLATVDLTATLVPAIAFSPQTVDFGPAAAGVPHSATITATAAPRLLRVGRMPELRSSDPSVRITRLTSPPNTRLTGRAVPLTYRLTLAPDAPLGPLSGRFYLVPPPQDLGGRRPGPVRRRGRPDRPSHRRHHAHARTDVFGHCPGRHGGIGDGLDHRQRRGGYDGTDL